MDDPLAARLPGRRGLAVPLIILAVMAAATGSAAGQTRKTSAVTQFAVPLSPEARQDLAQRVLAHPDVLPGHRLAAIRVTAASAADASGKTRSIVTVVFFDHTALEARRVTIDAVSNEVLSNERLPGTPQGSAEEFAEAVEIVRRDAGLAQLLDRGAVLDGGFIVADPAGSRRRMMQLKLMSGDRHTLLRSITVDLTRRELVTASMAAAPAEPRPKGGG